LAELPGDFRLRLSSIEATEVTHELMAVMADHAGRVCPHLHVSMQSGSDAVLRRMRRRWGSRRYVDRCRMFCDRLDHAAITTDIIVGFPGETDEDFAATCRVAREVGFSKIHIFPFSPRRGTAAAEMPGQLPKQVKQQRVRHLADVEAELRDDYCRGLLGRRLQVLVEGTSGHDVRMLAGTSCRYVPVDLPKNAAEAGEFAEVTAAGVAHGRIRGE
jgi:threonylcarbamoyladenosine tRNA methylthiotransferase MtaB